MSVQWIPEHRCCPVCESTAVRTLGVRGGAAHHAGRGVATSVVRCRSCHAVYQKPVLIPQGNPYDEHEPESYFALHDDREKIQFGEFLAREAERRLGRVGRMLEIGCGRGDILRGALSRGWEVHGVEFTEAYADAARAYGGIDVECAPAETAIKLGNAQYEVVLLAAVLEHVYEPKALLNRIRDVMVPGGLLFVDVPNECSFMTHVANAYMRARGRDWVVNLSPTFPPFHVVGFCPRSLRHLLESTGFALVDLAMNRWNNDLPRRTGFVGAFERAGMSAALRIGHMLGMGAGIACWAVRR